MLFLFLGAGLLLLPLLLRLAIRLRLGVPLLYAIGMLTVFHSWYQAHTALADGIFFALVGLAALSWVVTAARKAHGLAYGLQSGPQRTSWPAECGRQGQRRVRCQHRWAVGLRSAQSHQLPDEPVAHLDGPHQNQHIKDQFSDVVPHNGSRRQSAVRDGGRRRGKG